MNVLWKFGNRKHVHLLYVWHLFHQEEITSTFSQFVRLFPLTPNKLKLACASQIKALQESDENVIQPDSLRLLIIHLL